MNEMSVALPLICYILTVLFYLPKQVQISTNHLNMNSISLCDLVLASNLKYILNPQLIGLKLTLSSSLSLARKESFSGDVENQLAIASSSDKPSQVILASADVHQVELPFVPESSKDIKY